MWLWPKTTTAASGKRRRSRPRPPGARARVVDHRDANAGDVDHELLGEAADQLGVVVPQHRVHRREARQLLEQLGYEQVARMQDDVGALELGAHRVGQTPA